MLTFFCNRFSIYPSPNCAASHLPKGVEWELLEYLECLLSAKYKALHNLDDLFMMVPFLYPLRDIKLLNNFWNFLFSFSWLCSYVEGNYHMDELQMESFCYHLLSYFVNYGKWSGECWQRISGSGWHLSKAKRWWTVNLLTTFETIVRTLDLAYNVVFHIALTRLLREGK